MKFWIFYHRNIDDFDELGPYEIYAYTNNKDLAKNFKDTRNMNNFYLKKMDLDRKEYNDLYRNYMNQILEWFTGTTRDNTGIMEFSIALTRQESIFTTNQATLMLHESLYRYAWFPIDPLKKEYKKALNILNYQGIRDYILRGETDTHIELIQKMHTDDLRLILNNYGDLFLKEGD